MMLVERSVGEQHFREKEGREVSSQTLLPVQKGRMTSAENISPMDKEQPVAFLYNSTLSLTMQKS